MKKLDKENVQEIVGLNMIQSGMLFHYLKDAQDNVYNVQLALSIEGSLDVNLLAAALQAVQAENDILRSVFRWENITTPVQIILHTCPVGISYLDISGTEKEKANTFIETFLQADSNRRFELYDLPLRISVLKKGENSFVLCISHHHILYDGWSTGIFLKELFAHYYRLHSNLALVAAVKPSYKEVVQTLNIKNDSIDARLYWKEFLKDYNTGLLFSTVPVDASEERALKKIQFTVSLADLDLFARQQRVTKSAVIYTAYGILLQRYLNSEDVTFGTTVSSRGPGHENVIGNFINTIPLRITGSDDQSLLDTVIDLNTHLIERNQYVTTSYSDIKQLLGLKPSEGLFDSIVVIENYPLDGSLLSADNDLKIKLLSVYENTGIPLVVTVYFRNEVEIEFVYSEPVACSFDLQTFGTHFVRILQEILYRSGQFAGTLNLLDETEKCQLVHTFNDTSRDYSHEETIIGLFEKKVIQFAGNAAIHLNRGTITYSELNAQANKIAFYLTKKQGISRGSLVGVLLERDELLIPFIYGILKAGAVYVPLDPNNPGLRIMSVVEDAGLSLLITRSQYKEKVVQSGIAIADLDVEWEYISQQPEESIAVPVRGNELAYVIYTSGSTGMPKGVMVEHRSLLNIIQCLHNRYSMDAGDVYLFKTTHTFDVSLAEIFGWFSAGGSVAVLPPERKTDMRVVVDTIDKFQVSHLNFVPSLFAAFVDELEQADTNCISSLKYIFLAGEALSADLVIRFNKLQTGIQLENIYGPTESTVYCCGYAIGQVKTGDRILIGKPLDNIKLYILDDKNQLKPVGAPGELCISGAGLARGYWHNEEQTRSKFVPNPFIDGEMMYRSGDLVRWTKDGNIEYLGRIDNQVKIRGFRIETAEIEQQINAHDDIKDSVVIAWEQQGDKHLIAYFVTERPVNKGELRLHLQQRLPDYMIPSFFIELQSLPLSSSGKLDRKSLPAPEIKKEENFTAASNQIQEKLLAIWSAVLNVPADKISTQVNFFDLGGDSIKLISVSSRIRKVFNKNISVSELFNYPSVARLADYIASEHDISGDGAVQKKSVNSIKRTLNNDIAIIGMAGRFPGSTDVNEFWLNVRSGKESITRNIEEDQGDSIVNAKGYLEDHDSFDADFFSYLPSEAELMDPQMTIFHECVWHALENAGYNHSSYDGSIGLYGGASMNPYYNLSGYRINSTNWMEHWDALTYSDKDFLCARVSYRLNLKGPSVNITTACSTSLVAIDTACTDLLAGKCNIAVAGGISITQHDNNGYLYQKDMILSPDGRCRAFDENAAGTIGGNGAGVVVLKRLDDAIRDGDLIYAVIKGTATNNDGNEKIGFTAPGIGGQSDVIRKAINNAGIPVESITYIEAHGTGTSLGDPIEIAGLTRAFGTDKKQYCAIGSVKTNIGHLDAAAGVAGLIKTVLALQHRQLPPSLHFTTPNPKIDFTNSPFYVNTELKEWKSNGYPLRAGVSSFGIGGTNAHVIVEEAPVQPESSAGSGPQLLLFSAKTPAALQRNIERFSSWLKANEKVKLADIAYTLQTGRASFEHRQLLVCDSHAAAIEALPRLPSTDNYSHVSSRHTPVVVFMFSGQGSQYAGMCGDLYEQEPVFKAQVDSCCELVKQRYQKDLLPVMFPGPGGDSRMIDNTEYTQPALFIIEYALTMLLESRGIRPAMMIGHSIGEYTAACLSGVFSLEDALHVVVKRGELMQQATRGSMLSVSVSEAQLRELLKEHPQISLAAVNSSQLCAVSGSNEAIEVFEQAVKQSGHLCRPIRTSHAFHSWMMDEVLDEYAKVMSSVRLQVPQRPFISNVSGVLATAAQVTTPGYWVEHLRQTVRFGAGIESLFINKEAVFIEVGPGKVLSSLVQLHGQRQEGHRVVSMVKQAKEAGNDQHHLLQGIGALWLNGLPVNWQSFYKAGQRRRVSLPGYSFERTKYGSRKEKLNDFIAGENTDARPEVKRLSDWFYIPTWKRSFFTRNNNHGSPKISLLFIDDEGVGAGITKKWRHNNELVLTVKPGDVFFKNTDDSYCINPNREEDYHKLAEDIHQRGIRIDRIVHAWGVSKDRVHEIDAEAHPEQLDHCLYSVLYILKSINKIPNNFGKNVVVLTNDVYDIGVEAPPSPFKSMVRGILTVLSQEFPGFSARQIDCTLQDRDRGDFIEKLCNEITQSGSDKICSLRRGQKWVQVFDACQVPDLPAEIHNNGYYLVTGGLGNVGFALTNYLVTKHQANIILLGQTKLSNEDGAEESGELRELREKRQRLNKLQKINDKSQIIYFSCDVSNRNEVKAIVEEGKKRFGALHGVIHAAGVVEGTSIRSVNELCKEDFEYQLSAKAKGIQVLANVLRDEDPDFVFATSSLASILGGVGFAAYAAANIYMDNFIARGREMGELENWISVNLDGINFNDTVEDSRILNAKELQQVFESVLKMVGVTAQIVVSKTNLQKRLAGWVNTGEPAISDAQPDQGSASAHNIDVEKTLEQLWISFFGRSVIHREDNFFDMGGDSMMALRMLGRIHKTFNVELSIRDFFDNPAINQLVLLIKKMLGTPVDASGALHYSPIVPAALKDYYRVSSIQQRLYFLYQFDSSSLSYNMTQLFTLQGEVDKDRLTDALNTLLDRHDSLRTSFEVVAGNVVQKVNQDVRVVVEYFTAGENDANEIISGFIRPFDLAKAPLIRAGLISSAGNAHIFIIDMHHIITDGVSKNILIREFISLYRGEEFKNRPLQYIDYVESQQQENLQLRAEKQKAFWLDQFSEEITPIDLPVDYSRPLLKTDAGDVIYCLLSKEEAATLTHICEKEGVSMFMVLLAVYNVLLAKVSNQEDIIVGTPVSGRRHPDVEHIVGLFLNTLPLRNYPRGEMSFKEFLALVKGVSLAGFENQEYQYEDLIEALQLDRNTGRNPLFDIWFMYQQKEETIFELPGFVITPVEHHSRLSKFDLSLEVFESGGNVTLQFEYATALFKAETIHRFIGYLRKIIASIGADITKRIADIEILSDEEKDRLLFEYNNTQCDYPSSETIISLFQQQVAKTPDKTALVYEKTKLTYRELDEASSRLASNLRNQYQVQPNDIIAIMADRSERMIIGLFGILKSGAAYLPVDPNYPADRIRYMLEDSAAQVLLICEPMTDDITYQGRIAEYHELIENGNTGLSLFNKSADLCYVIYTSGSTGKPKGVKICHRNVVNFMAGMNRNVPVSSNDCMLAITSTSFDISVLEIFWTICNGVEVVLSPSDISMSGLDRYVDEEQASIDFSLFFFSSYKNDTNNKYDLLLQSVKYADESGFKAVWTPERHFHEFGGLFPNPSVISAALATITKNIEIRSGSIVCPLHDPIRVAEEWSVVDNLTGGRVGLSFASGWNPNDFVLAREHYKERQKIMYAQIEQIRKLWRGEAIKRENGLDKETDVHIYPLPIQKELPVWITSGGNEETFKSAGAAGANLLTHFLGQNIQDLAAKIKLYRSARTQHGYKAEDGKVTIMLHTFIGGDADEVERIVEAPFTEYLKSSIGLNKILSEELGLQQGDIPDEVLNNALKNAFLRYYKTSSLIGTKSKCAEMVLQLREIGVDEIACLIDFGVAQDKVLQSLRQLKELKEMLTGQLSAHSRITLLQSTPAFIRMIDEGVGSKKLLQSLRILMVGGDMVPVALVNHLQKETRAIIYNMYGPTETTIWSCMHRFEDHVEKISVGKPMANTQVYILDKYLRLVPQGVPGDLYIGGDGLSAGYLNRPELTMERFVVNPINKNTSIYKTGDLARWLEHGTIELLGRSDNQVKIRGYRIELGEIEQLLNGYTSISENLVVAREREGNKYLVAYYVSDTRLDAKDLRAYLLQRLPDYMVPSFFMQLEHLPLTSNGKLNRKALPEPGKVHVGEYVAPVTAEQQLLSDIWKMVLGAERVGIRDNFFSVGGDSIKSIQIIARVRAAGYEVTIKNIFTSQTIEALAPLLKPMEKQSDQAMVTGEAVLTPVQRWFFQQDRKFPQHYNQAVMLHFKEGISAATVIKIFEQLQYHHDGLRTVFKKGVTGWQASILPATNIKVSVTEQDLRGDSDGLKSLLSACNEVQGSIDLTNGPLMRLGLFHLPDGTRLLIVIHHLVIDGISWRILFEDIETLYQQHQQEKAFALPLKTDSFQSWPAYLLQYSYSAAFRDAMQYWKQVLDRKVTSIVRDNKNGSNRVKDGVTKSLRISSEQTTKLLTQTHYAYNTRINDVLLAGLLLALHRTFGTRDVMIDMEGHGREAVVPDVNINRTTGWFTSIYPVILTYNEGSLGRLLKEVKENLRKVPNSGIDYLIGRFMTDAEDAYMNVKSPIMFNYLGQFDADTRNRSYQIAKESTGDMMAPESDRDYDWEIVGMVESGELQLNITYSSEQYRNETMTALVNDYRKELEELITYCCSLEEQGLTPSDLTYDKLTMDQLDALQEKYAVRDIYPLSPMQEGILLHYLLDEAPELFLVQVSYDLHFSQLNIQAVERSLNELIKRYDVLRTLFLFKGYERPLQLVLRENKADFTYKDIREEGGNEMHQVLASYITADQRRGFNVGEEVPMRLSVYRTAASTYTFVWSYHHLLMDGWCMGILINDFRKIYSALMEGIEFRLPAVKPYSNYIKWLENQKNDVGLYWKKYLAGYESLATLPKQRSITGPYVNKLSGTTVTLNQAQLHTASTRYGITMNTLLQAVWSILLSKYNNVNDVAFGAVVSGRPATIEGVEEMVGLFINTVPVRVTFDPGDTIAVLLQRLQQQLLEIEPYHYHPLAEIQSYSSLGRNLIDHVLVFENYPIARKVENNSTGGNRIDAISNVQVAEQNNYNYNLMIIPGEEIMIRLEFNANMYDHAVMERVLLHFKQIAEQVMTDADVLVADVSMLTAEEEHRVLYGFNETQANYPNDKTIIDLFEEQVNVTPDNVAVIYEDRSITYQTLQEQSDKIAFYLQEVAKVEPGDLVGLMLERSEFLIPFIFGILKSGAAYVPIDPHYPPARITSILEGAALKVLVTAAAFSKMPAIGGRVVVNVNEEWDNILQQPSKKFNSAASAAGLAYVIYTSGSTGKPKGVMIEHQSVLNRLFWMQKQYPLHAGDVLLQKTPIVFDVSVWELFWWSFLGASLCVLPPHAEKDPVQMINAVERSKVSVMHFVPSMLGVFLAIMEEDFDFKPLSTLRLVFSSGEALKPEQVNAFGNTLHKHAGTRLSNLYGPTEATVDVTYYDCGFESECMIVPIGKPIDNVRLYVLDKNDRAMPVGVAGELCIAGIGLARGYLNNEALTNEKFNMLSRLKERVYRTGDLARWLPDGNIEYLGRIDHQVKLRGFRIEMEEIEHCLNKHENIKENVVIPIDREENKYLVAYYVSEHELSREELQQLLLCYLPEYMVPAFFVHMRQLPINSNGKLDRKALPAPDVGDVNHYTAPSDKMEEQLTDIWADILRIDKGVISVDRSFFELGGHSLKATLLINKINKVFGVDISITEIFNKPSVKSMAEHIDASLHQHGGVNQLENIVEIVI